MLGSAGKTVIVVSHDIEFLWPMQPRVVVMKAGKVVGDGPAPKVMMDRDLVSGARVAQPEMVRFYLGLRSRPPGPFVHPLDARGWLEGSRP
jgi:ABC-type uncharacterized transport system ATPase subunit